MIVAEPHQGKGYGRRLVHDRERLVAGRGALTLVVGTSDETDRTTPTAPTCTQRSLTTLQS